MNIYIPKIVDKAIYRTLFMPEYEKINCFIDFTYQLTNLIKEELLTYGILGNSVPINPKCKIYSSDKNNIDYLLGYTYMNFYEQLLPTYNNLLKLEHFGNIIVPIKNDNININEIVFEDLSIEGYCYNINLKNKKSFLYLAKVKIKDKFLNEYKNLIDSINKNYSNLLDEFNSSLIPLFIDRITGNLYTCECFKEQTKNLILREYLKKHSLEFNFSRKIFDTYKELKKLYYKPNICHICTDTLPKYPFGNTMYYSIFDAYYLPYLHIQNLKEKLGLKRKWHTEFILYKIIKDIFKNFTVIQHYKISKYEIDIFIKELKLAIEYQGEQHFKPYKHLGGEKGLQERKKRDNEKYSFLIKKNFIVIYFDYKEDLLHKYVANKIFNIIGTRNEK